MSINVIITFQAKPEQSSALGTLLNRAKHHLPEVEGCNGALLFNSKENPCVFTLVEEWDSDIQHKAHMANVVSSGAWTNIASHLVGDPVSNYYIKR